MRNKKYTGDEKSWFLIHIYIELEKVIIAVAMYEHTSIYYLFLFPQLIVHNTRWRIDKNIYFCVLFLLKEKNNIFYLRQF